MHGPAPAFLRLLGALEELSVQEARHVTDEDYAAVRQVQERAAPLVTELARLGAGAADAATARPRLAALLERRQQCQDRLARQIARVREALLCTQAHQRRVAQVAPAYGGQALGGPLRQLQVQG